MYVFLDQNHDTIYTISHKCVVGLTYAFRPFFSEKIKKLVPFFRSPAIMGNHKDPKNKSHTKSGPLADDDAHHSPSGENSDHDAERRSVRFSPPATAAAGDVPDWKSEMRQEIRSVQAESMQGFRFSSGPAKIDAADVIIESECVKDVMKRIETQHRDNSTAIRLASIPRRETNSNSSTWWTSRASWKFRRQQ
jgi:hypothetical protein